MTPKVNNGLIVGGTFSQDQARMCGHHDDDWWITVLPAKNQNTAIWLVNIFLRTRMKHSDWLEFRINFRGFSSSSARVDAILTTGPWLGEKFLVGMGRWGNPYTPLMSTNQCDLLQEAYPQREDSRKVLLDIWGCLVVILEHFSPCENPRDYRIVVHLSGFWMVCLAGVSVSQ